MKLNKHTHLSILLFLFIIAFVACKKAQYHSLTTDEEESWGIYKLNETFKFISTQGDLRTYNTGGRFKAYNKEGNIYDEYLYSTIFLVGDSSDYFYNRGYRGLFIDKTADGLSVKVGLPHFYANVKINDKAPTTQNINGLNYSDVYIVAANPLNVDSINYIDSIFYSQSYGFLKYTDRYGETFLRTQ